MNPAHSTQTLRSYLIANIAVIFIGLFINQTLQTIGGVVTTRLLHSQTLYGQVSVMQQVLGMSGLFLNVGLNSATTFFVARHGKKALASIFGPAFLFSILGALLVALVICGLSPTIATIYHIKALAPALDVGSVSLLLSAAINMCVAVFSGMKKFVVQSMMMVTTTLFSISGTILGVWWYLSSPSSLYLINVGVFCGGIVTLTIALLYLTRQFHIRFFVPVRLKTVWRMLRYGLPSFAGNIAKSFQQSYLVIITGGTSLIAAGYLNNSLKIAGYANIVTWAFNIVSLPFLSEVMRSPIQSRERATLCFRYNNLVLFPITLLICLYPDPILYALFGSYYVSKEADQYTVLTAIGVMFSSVSRLGGTLLAGIGKPRANFFTMIVSGSILFVIAPIAAAHQPVLATFVYVIGWMLSAITLFYFLFKDGLRLSWRAAFIEPMIPTFMLWVMLELGLQDKSIDMVTFPLAVLCSLLGTYFLEKRHPFAASTQIK